MLIDTHCHLDAAEFDSDRYAVHAAAVQAGVDRIVVPAISARQFAVTRDCVARYPGCVAAYGIHPLYVEQAQPEDLERLRSYLSTQNPVAVGEIGLDFYVPGLDVAKQTAFLVDQLKLAREFDLPVLLHVRRAVDAVLKELRRIRVRGGIAHAFNGSRQQAEIFIQLGFKLGFGGSATFSGSTRIREMARSLPLACLVLETDAPDIPPAWLNGGRNSPDQLLAIAQEIADLRGIPLAELAEATSANARAVLPRLG